MKYILEPSRTFGEFLILPNLTTKDCIPSNVDLTTPLVKYKKGQKPSMSLKIPFASAIMQAVSGVEMAKELGRLGGIAFIFCSQTIEAQAEMIKEAKKSNVLVGAGVNTHDFETRIPALVKAGADILCMDSSDGYSIWQKNTIDFVRKNYGDKVKIGAGNVVSSDAFRYLADAGADFIKVGIGGGSICITREQKGIGRGQASALISVVEERDKYFEETGIYIPVCSDGGIVYDQHVIIALAMGADFIMMGRYFARFEESNGNIITIGDKQYKEFWGEGSQRAANWQRYGTVDGKRLKFEEGVDSLIPLKGKMQDTLDMAVAKIKSTFCNCGSTSIKQFKETTRLTVISAASIVEGGAHDVSVRKD